MPLNAAKKRLIRRALIQTLEVKELMHGFTTIDLSSRFPQLVQDNTLRRILSNLKEVDEYITSLMTDTYISRTENLYFFSTENLLHFATYTSEEFEDDYQLMIVQALQKRSFDGPFMDAYEAVLNV